MYPLLKLVLTDMHSKVQEFNRPLFHEKSDITMILELLMEEMREYENAIHPKVQPVAGQLLRIAEAIDGVCDMLYVLLNYVYMCNKHDLTVEDSPLAKAVIAQLAYELNPSIVFCFDIVHESNMSKQVDGVFLINHPDRPWFNEYLPTGKVIKPDTYKKVEPLTLLMVYRTALEIVDMSSVSRMFNGVDYKKLQEECNNLTDDGLLTLLKEVCV